MVKIDHRQNMVCHTPFNTEFNSVIGSNELISQISAVYEIVKNLTIGFRDRGSLFDSNVCMYGKYNKKNIVHCGGARMVSRGKSGHT